MSEPVLVQSDVWFASLKPDGAPQTIGEAIHTIKRARHAFSPGELEQVHLCPTDEGTYRECSAETAGALAAWVLRL